MKRSPARPPAHTPSYHQQIPEPTLGDEILEELQPRRKKRRFLALFLLVVLISGMVWQFFAQPWLIAITQPAPQPRHLFQVTLLGVDIGADAHPAKPGTAGYVIVWYHLHNAEQVRPVLRLPGAPALPLTRDKQWVLLPHRGLVELFDVGTEIERPDMSCTSESAGCMRASRSRFQLPCNAQRI